jgi:O-acetyl-ADP-ribose deacetylase (regulator of RNase III)
MSIEDEKRAEFIYTEEHVDIFTLDDSEYHFAHCIASDLGMGAGIAVPFRKKYGLRGRIQKVDEPLKHPTCILTPPVFNLITKRVSSGKPTYDSMRISLIKMKEHIVENDIKKVAMPKIGCGLDRLQWGAVREMIKDIFGDLDIKVKVCVWRSTTMP